LSTHYTLREEEGPVKELLAELRASIAATALLAVLCCALYPAAVWGIARSVFPGRADGSLITAEGKVAGSSLIGQPFSGAGYFHPRPSAAGAGYDASASSGTNLGPLSKKLVDDVRGRVAEYRRENGLENGALVPADAVTSSASGLDPHISPANARMQAPRVAAARGMKEGDVLDKVLARTEGRTFGILGEPRVNVLLLNLALDGKL
jgi:K+-transporting ATPase ATPase C chain